MTFILALLHRDFAIMAADKLAHMSGQATLQMGSQTITVNSPSINLIGYNKLAFDKPRLTAIGVAGTIHQHDYLARLEACNGPDECTQVIATKLNQTMLEDRSILLKRQSFTQNEGLAVFFDEFTDAFATLIYSFALPKTYALWTIGEERPSLVHVGSGAANFEKGVPTEEISSFCGSVTTVEDLPRYAEWFGYAFKQVAAVDQRVSPEWAGVIAARADRVFKPL